MKINYRPEIDGLRAISVFAIIFYHADFNYFKGGFIGVDIFFVISGYLITSIILREIHYTNKFSIKKFYERRARRIFPVLFVVIAISFLFAYLILLPNSFVDFARSVISSIFFISNLYFHYTGIEYGAPDSSLFPLIHTWSLSVEEQFYILFPIFCLIIFKYFSKHFFSILFLLFCFSLFFSQYCANFHPSFNFYSLPTRSFELLFGSLLSYFQTYNETYKKAKTKRYYKILNLTLPTIGFSLIFFSIIFYTDRMLLPSFLSLVPLVGTALIILFSNKNEIVTKVLSNKIFVFFGLISYSMYLWHWPFFAFQKYLFFETNDIFYLKILYLFLIIVISIFSYYLIEIPFRNKNFISLKKIIIIFTINILFLLLLASYVVREDGIKNRFPPYLDETLRNQKKISLYKTGSSKNIILLGDSHADSLEYILNKNLIGTNFNLYRFRTHFFITKFNFINRKTKRNDKNFFKDNEEIKLFLKEKSNLTIIWTQRWTAKLLEEYFDNREGFTEYKKTEDKFYDSYLEPINIKTVTQSEREKYISDAILSSINDIVSGGHKLILVYPVPEIGFDPDRILLANYLKNKIFFKKSSPEILSGSFAVYKERNKKIFDILDSVQNENIYRVYPHSYFCDNQIKNRCITNNENHIFYYDNNHLSIQGSKFIVNDILKIIKNKNIIR